MNNIEWKEGAVCYASGKQWIAGPLMPTVPIIKVDDFQLNEIRTGDYIPASELDTEQKYNDAVEVFGLFGIKAFNLGRQSFERLQRESFWCLGVDSDNSFAAKNKSYKGVRKISLKQLMAIGKLKRMMLGREDVKTQLEKWGGYAGKENTIKYNPDSMMIKDGGLVIAKPKRRNKSKQAYDILKSLDYEYDLVKQKWFRKEWV